MRNLLAPAAAALVFAQAASAQTLPNDLPDRPYVTITDNDFAWDYGNWQQFNGADTLQNRSAGTLEVIASKANEGIQSKVLLASEAEHRMIVCLSDVVGAVGVYTEWADLVETITEEGCHTLRFRTRANAATTRPVITSRGVGSFSVDYVQLARLNPARDIPSLADVDAAVQRGMRTSGRVVYYRNDFEQDIDGTSMVGVVRPTQPSDGALEITLPGGSTNFVTFAGGLTPDTGSVLVSVDLTLVSGEPVTFIGAANDLTSKPYTIRESGRYYFPIFRARPNNTNASYDGVAMYSTSRATVRVNDITLFASLPDETPGGYSVIVGAENEVVHPIPATGDRNPSVTIGYDVDNFSHQSVAIGSKSVTGVRPGGKIISPGQIGPTGGGQVTLGHYVLNPIWKNIAIGAYVAVLAQSSGAIGNQSRVSDSHIMAIGRGVNAPRVPEVIARSKNRAGNDKRKSQDLTVFAESDIYAANGLAHRYPAALNGKAFFDDLPRDRDVRLFGRNAKDARHVDYVSGSALQFHTYYKPGTDSLFAAQVSNPSSTPTKSSPDWAFVQIDVAGRPSSFNVDGGDVAVIGGMQTGTGKPGRVFFGLGKTNVSIGPNQTADYEHVGGFDANVDPADNTGTDMVLLDRETNTIRRVDYEKKHPADGTGRVVSFARLTLK